MPHRNCKLTKMNQKNYSHIYQKTVYDQVFAAFHRTLKNMRHVATAANKTLVDSVVFCVS